MKQWLRRLWHCHITHRHWIQWQASFGFSAHRFKCKLCGEAWWCVEGKKDMLPWDIEIEMEWVKALREGTVSFERRRTS